MFVLKPVPDTIVEVSIQVPGEKQASTLQARWKLHQWDAFQERVTQMREGELTDDALVADDLLDLEGVQDEKGNAVEFSTELRDQLMQLVYVRRPLIASWFEAQQGRGAAAAKN